MLSDGLLKRAEGFTPYFYHLKSHPKAYSEQNYKHEKIGADIYISLIEYLAEWNNRPDKFLNSYGIQPDRLSVINGEIILWEIDRSTMKLRDITGKIEKYLSMAPLAPKHVSVVFACTSRRGKSILQLLDGIRNRNVWFFVVDYRELIADPRATLFHSAVSDDVTLKLPSLES
jgi:Replication-relaxation